MVNLFNEFEYIFYSQNDLNRNFMKNPLFWWYKETIVLWIYIVKYNPENRIGRKIQSSPTIH